MSLASEYRCQYRWRDWRTVLAALPPLKGATVLDLGCGVGDLASELVARGAQVVGIDADKDLIQEARSRGLSTADFRTGDLRESLNLECQVDGIWCSYTAAYFPDFPETLRRWAKHLRPGGWIAVTEVDDLFGHEPLRGQTKTLLNAYAEEALAAGRYDFRMGRKLESHLRQAGFVVSQSFTLVDQELSFNGRARPEVLVAWGKRFARMERLRSFCGEAIPQVEEDFKACLGRDDHQSLAKVYCCIARKEPLA